jgi:apolipoprotein N-acyltransferase
MSDRLTVFLSILVVSGIALFAFGWAIPMLINKHEDWALWAAGLLALGAIAFVWSAVEHFAPLLGFGDKKETTDE